MLNTKKWKSFIYNRIFIIRKGFYNKKPDSSENGEIPFLGATDSNNGVTSYHTIDDINNASKTGDDNNSPISDKIFPANAVCVTNNGSVGYAYYQPKKFTCSHDVNPLYRKDGIPFNHKTGLFIATVIMKDRYRWQYGRKWRPVRMVKSTINLPVLTDNYGQCIIDSKKTFSDEGYIPDWKYMEEFIERLETRERESQGSIRNALKTENKIEKVPELNINDWKDFIIGKLFKIKRGKRLIEEDRESGDVFYFSASQDNNGLTDKIANPLFIESDSLIYSTFGDCYYVEGEFTASDEISILQNDNLNKNIGLFIATIINKNKYKYAYGRKAFQNKFVNESIKLPIKKDENNRYLIDNYKEYSDEGYIPDWGFMENYIKSLPYGDKI
jgi:hypothetical protein